VTLPFDEPATRRRLIVEADGGSRGNPGPAAYGALVRDPDSGDVIRDDARYLGETTNNVAEYSGLVSALTMARAIDPDALVEARLDSKLVVEQMSGRWKIKHEAMRALALQARALLPRDQVTYRWVPRAQNSAADRLANEAMDLAARGREWVSRLAPYAETTQTGTHDEETASMPKDTPDTPDPLDAPDSVDATDPLDAVDEVPGLREPLRLQYRVLTGPDDDAFCRRVSDALADGYELHGGPAITHDGARVIVAQAVVDVRQMGFGA
jgi:ribonuclease HI